MKNIILLILVFVLPSICYSYEEEKNTEKKYSPHLQIWADKLMYASLGVGVGIDIPFLYEDVSTEERNDFVVGTEIGLSGIKVSLGYVNTADLRFILWRIGLKAVYFHVWSENCSINNKGNYIGAEIDFSAMLLFRLGAYNRTSSGGSDEFVWTISVGVGE